MNYTFLQIILTAIAGYIGTVHSGNMNRLPRPYQRNGVRYNQGFFGTRTIYWYIFVSCSIIALTLTFLSNRKDNVEKDILKRKAEVSDSLYLAEIKNFSNKITRSDTLHTQLFTSYVKQLNKWGLTIRDSMIVRQDGYIRLIPHEPFIKFDTINNKLQLTYIFMNEGTAVADDVTIQVFYALKENLSAMNSVTTFTSSFGSQDAIAFHRPITNQEFEFLKRVFIIFKITYPFKGSIIKHTYGIRYDYDRDIWGTAPIPFN